MKIHLKKLSLKAMRKPSTIWQTDHVFWEIAIQDKKNIYLHSEQSLLKYGFPTVAVEIY